MAEFTMSGTESFDTTSTAEGDGEGVTDDVNPARDGARTTRERAGAVLRAVLAVLAALGAVGGAGGGYLWYKGRAAQPVELAMTRQMQLLRKLPEYAKRLGEEKVAPQDANTFVSDLARKGMHRLDDSVLVRAAVVVGKILDGAPTSECAAIARRPVLAQVLVSPEAMTRTDSATATEYVTLQFRAATAELRHVSARQPSDSAVVEAMTALMGRLPTSARQRLVKAETNLGAASDADACWAARTIYRGARTAPEPQRSVLARAVLVDP